MRIQVSSERRPRKKQRHSVPRLLHRPTRLLRPPSTFAAPGGSTGLVLDDSTMVYAVATKKPDGTISFGEVTGGANAKVVVATPKSPVKEVKQAKPASKEVPMTVRQMLLSAALVAPSLVHAAATITIVNGDPAGVGFNDATVVAPVGGNTGTTLGQQRLNAFQAAANKWGATLTAVPTIRVLATWEALTCTATSAVLGSAGATEVFRDFTGAPRQALGLVRPRRAR